MPPGSLAEMGGAPKSSSADLSANPKYSEVNTLKEQGNQMWKIGVQEIACTAYSTAIEKLQTIVRKESPVIIIDECCEWVCESYACGRGAM